MQFEVSTGVRAHGFEIFNMLKNPTESDIKNLFTDNSELASLPGAFIRAAKFCLPVVSFDYSFSKNLGNRKAFIFLR